MPSRPTLVTTIGAEEALKRAEDSMRLGGIAASDLLPSSHASEGSKVLLVPRVLACLVLALAKVARW